MPGVKCVTSFDFLKKMCKHVSLEAFPNLFFLVSIYLNHEGISVKIPPISIHKSDSFIIGVVFQKYLILRRKEKRAYKFRLKT